MHRPTPETPLILWQLPSEDYNNSSTRSYQKRPPSYLKKTDSIYYDHDRGFTIEDKKEATLEDENMEANVQVIEYLNFQISSQMMSTTTSLIL